VGGIGLMGVHFANLVRSLAPDVWWRLGDITGSGQTAADSSGNGFNATSFGGVSQVDGTIVNDNDKATAFDGASTGYVQTPSNMSGWNSAVTAILWVHSDALAGTSELIEHRNGNITTDFTFRCLRTSSSSCTLGTELNNGSWHTVTAGVNVPLGWNMLAVTRSADYQTVKYYVNGLSGATASFGAIAQAPNYKQPFAIARSYGWSAFTGSIDEPMLWKRELSAGEILALYNRSVQKFIDLNRQMRMRNWRVA
jgi:hypothetical protein